MSLLARITSVKADGQQLRVAFNIIPSGSYVTAGDTLNLASATQDPNFIGMVPQIEALGAPISLDIWSAGGNITNHYYPVIGATQATCKMKVDSAFNTELSAGAYPAAVLADTIQGEAIFNKL